MKRIMLGGGGARRAELSGVDASAQGSDLARCSSDHPCRGRGQPETRVDYVVVTPARDEAANLSRLAACLVAQTMTPTAWIVVDHGSHDGTLEIAERLAREHEWIWALSITGPLVATRGGPVVRAVKAGLAALPAPTKWWSSWTLTFHSRVTTSSACSPRSKRIRASASRAARASNPEAVDGARAGHRHERRRSEPGVPK